MDDKLLEALGRAQQSTDSAMHPPQPELDELLQPFASEEEESILDGAFARLDAGADADAAEDAAPVSASDTAGAAGSRSNVAQLADHRSRAPWIAAVVAIAAGLLLWFAFRSPAPMAPGLPAYDVVQLGGGVAEVRGAGDTQRTQLKPGDTIDWTFAPKTPARTKVGFALLAVGPKGETAFSVVSDAEVSEPGAVRLRGPFSSYLSLSPGVWTMHALFAAPDQLPASADDAIANGPWQKAEFQVTILAP